MSIYTVSESEICEVISSISGRDAYFNEIHKLNDIVFGGDCFISDSILPSQVGYGDGLSVIISDFLTDNNYETAIDYLADKKRDLLCIQVLTAEEINPKVRGKNIFYDSENNGKSYRKNINKDIINAYRQAVQYVQDRLLNYCNSRGANYMLVRDDKSVDEIFFENLTAMGVLK